MEAILSRHGLPTQMGAGLPDAAALHAVLEELLQALEAEAGRIAAGWGAPGPRAEFAPGAENLAWYLALRRHDIRPLQRLLMVLGLSSLGRLESRVRPALQAVRATLAGLAGLPPAPRPAAEDFFAGERALARHTAEVLGPATPQRPVGLLVTCPSEAADDPGFMLQLARRGVEAVRLNCAHDDAAAWGRMIRHRDAAAEATGHRMRVLMDLAGPKIRTGALRLPGPGQRVMPESLLAVVPPGGLGEAPEGPTTFAAECTLPEVLEMVAPGDRLFVDDGKIETVVERKAAWGLLARVTRVPEDGAKLRSEKGLNFPDTTIRCAALSEKDREDLAFVARHADGIEYSFVQSAEDIRLLQAALAEHRPEDWRTLSLVLKIETTRAVRALPEMLVQAAGQQPTAIMIARGDLAVEIGFARTAEMQEEILWLGEAAHVPVIWATQVLEHLVRKGTPLRGEMTDAAMAARAECIMLNKGPHLLLAIAELDGLLRRMGQHQYKKTPQLRALTSW
ncbi:pyruvate kinase [Siccirubricoccus phaeus]|uniref:pyruvate kinase n=1 Tax=Siccirubricoccus phaeus TaxID=2595053 RepID=UPI001F313F45|nr:pyruvate kinase [Siccirubricoccus phaeus]